MQSRDTWHWWTPSPISHTRVKFHEHHYADGTYLVNSDPPSQELALINSIIKGTLEQDQLRDFRTKYSYMNDDNAGSVGSGYWK